MQELLEGLNGPQREAVTHHDGPLLILAGPGSGKTRVVTHRIAHLLAAGVDPRGILALTFTNKAADEMHRRVTLLAPGADVWMGTFHRFGARLLRRHAALAGLQENYSIYDAEDSRRLLKRALQEAGVDLQYATPGQIAAGIGAAKSRVVVPEDYRARSGDPLGKLVEQTYPVYQRMLREANAVDFDDLLLLPACLLRDHAELRRQLDQRHAYILVDEYQDTNLAQYAIVRALSNELPNLAVTGDPDQSIYSWRGATISNILQFEQDYRDVRVVKLEQNYRSTPSILRAADALISHNTRRKPKRLTTDNEEGPPVRLVCYGTHRDEAREIAVRIAADVAAGRCQPQDVAIFYRVNALSRSLEHALREQGVPYQIVRGVEFYQRREIKDLLSYLQLLNNPRNDMALLRVINMPPRGIGARTLQRLGEHARRRRLPLLEAAREAGSIEELPRRSAVALAKFVHIMDSLAIWAHHPLEEILGRLIVESGYRDFLESSPLDEDQERLANVNELLNAGREFDEQRADNNLDAFLEQTALVNDTDQLDAEGGRVALMTLHAAKGLEFDHAYIVGVEQGLIPHERSRETEMEIEEERRLLFVGITRARRQLQLSYTLRRATRGGLRPTVSSRFLVELPREEMELHQPPGSYGRTSGGRGHDGHGWDESSQLPPAELDESFEVDPQQAGAGDFSAGGHPAAGSSAAAGESAAAGGAGEGAPAPLQTAAELAGEQAPWGPPASPDVFQHGMLVRHPEHGHGAIIALSGAGAKRQATVRFLGPAGTVTFRLAYSPLQPVAPQNGTRP